MQLQRKKVLPSFSWLKLICEDESFASRPNGTMSLPSFASPRYSYQQPSRRTSNYSFGATQLAPPAQNIQPSPRQEFRDRDRDYHVPRPRDRDSEQYRQGDISNGESSNASSNNRSHDQPHSQIQYPSSQRQYQDYSPPSTPTHPKQFLPPVAQKHHLPQPPYQSYGLPSPEPEADTAYPPVPPKPVRTFITRPATPPRSDATVDKKKKGSKLGKLKRFSLMKSKA